MDNAQKSVKVGRVVPEICSRTDKRTDTAITILRYPAWDGVISNI